MYQTCFVIIAIGLFDRLVMVLPSSGKQQGTLPFIVSPKTVPERKQISNLDGSLIELGRFAKSGTEQRADQNLRLNRIHNEIRNSGAREHPHYDIYIGEANMGLWKVVIQGTSSFLSDTTFPTAKKHAEHQFTVTSDLGPPESTYTGGTFLLYLEMGGKYPMFVALTSYPSQGNQHHALIPTQRPARQCANSSSGAQAGTAGSGRQRHWRTCRPERQTAQGVDFVLQLRGGFYAGESAWGSGACKRAQRDGRFALRHARWKTCSELGLRWSAKVWDGLVPRMNCAREHSRQVGSVPYS